MGNGMIRKRENKFTQISNDALRDETLSLKAIGLYSKINSYLTIPDWILYKTFLLSKCREGRESFHSAWEELKNSGYLIQHKIQDNNGKYYYEYELLDKITTYGFSVSGKTVHGKTTSGKPVPISNKDFSKTLNSNTDLSNNNSKKKITGNEKTPKEKDVVVNSSQIKFLIGEFKGKYNADLDSTRLKSLIKLKGLDHITECISTYANYINGRNINNIGGDFYTFVTKGYTKPVKQKATPQHANFEQREYNEDLFEKYSCNIQS